MQFIRLATANVPWLGNAVRKQEVRYRATTGRELDLSRAWWTPPLGPLQAWRLEAEQIESCLGAGALVSLTDHDNVDAGLHLRVLEETRDFPISVEWTVPFGHTFFHVGLHNLPSADPLALMEELKGITANPMPDLVARMFAWLHSSPDTLIVLNHPLWDENRIGESEHGHHVQAFLRRFGEFVHALELNGLRPCGENRSVVQLAAAVGLPVISGGDRHGREPNANLNLTNSDTFSGFVEEVRRDGWSDVLFMPRYRESFRMRILTNLCDILEDDPQHSMGWTKWCDRVFFRNEHDVTKSLTELWVSGYPAVVSQFVKLMSLVRHSQVRALLRAALREEQEFAL